MLCEFYSIVTNPRPVPKPRAAAEAMAAISSLLAFLHVLPVPAHAVDGLLDLLRRHPLPGDEVFDLQIVATMRPTASREPIPSIPTTLRFFPNSRL
jgi:hypothetical protein